MTTDKRFDDTISGWLQETAPARLPEHVLDATFERTRGSRQRSGWRARLAQPWSSHVTRPVLVLGIGTVVLLGTIVAVGASPSTDDHQGPFIGTWTSTSDADGGTQTMTVQPSDGSSFEIVVTDTIATVCSGAPSTMTGTGTATDNELVIPEPDYHCDDGSAPQASSGSPLEEQLRGLTYTIDPATDTLSVGHDDVWYRWVADAPLQTPLPQPAPTVVTMWPQTSPAEVSDAQRLADAGDDRYTWQVDPELVSWDHSDGKEPWGSEIFDRFIREKLGWEAYISGWSTGRSGYPSGGEGGPYPHLFVRCAPGQTNPLYPQDPVVGGCAPTIGDSRYETVIVTVAQPARRGATGIWVVTGWEVLQPGDPTTLYYQLHPQLDDPLRQVERLAPPSEAEIEASLGAFLQARIDGEGAERYLQLHEDDEPSSPNEVAGIRYATTDGDSVEEVPVLYSTTAGSPYVRSEIERVDGPAWPTGWIEFKVRLFAEDGTVVEQSFVLLRQDDGRLGLVYGSPDSSIPSTENGQSVPVPYRFLDGGVTFAAAPPWGDTILDPTLTVLGGVGRGSASQFTMFALVADPRTGTGCDSGAIPADAEALARSIRSNPDLEATAPVTVSVGGIDALQMDVVAAGPPDVGDCLPVVLEGLSAGHDAPMRLYLLDLPEGLSARLLAIAIVALDSEFDLVVEAAQPILDSIEFDTR